MKCMSERSDVVVLYYSDRDDAIIKTKIDPADRTVLRDMVGKNIARINAAPGIAMLVDGDGPRNSHIHVNKIRVSRDGHNVTILVRGSWLLVAEKDGRMSDLDALTAEKFVNERINRSVEQKGRAARIGSRIVAAEPGTDGSLEGLAIAYISGRMGGGDVIDAVASTTIGDGIGSAMVQMQDIWDVMSYSMDGNGAFDILNSDRSMTDVPEFLSALRGYLDKFEMFAGYSIKDKDRCLEEVRVEIVSKIEEQMKEKAASRRQEGDLS